MKDSLIILLFLISINLYGQQSTKVSVDLNSYRKGKLDIKVKPPVPESRSDWTFVIPTIIPGTYMKLNYSRFYKDFQAYDVHNNKLKVIRKKNRVIIKTSGNELSHLQYTIKESVGKGPIWESVLGCIGTIMTDSSFLFNFQLVNGYFEGFKDLPFELEISKPKEMGLYGSGALENISRSDSVDLYKSENYAELIDNPLLFAIPDTTWFRVDDNYFQVSVHAESGFVPADLVGKSIERIMKNVSDFSGFTTEDDYHFIIYYIDRDRIKGSFGLGSALEHKQSSVYYYSDSPFYDSLFRNLNNIVTHEYFHTFAPLNIHSQQIHDFNFDRPNMSAHGWLYEGSTDYLATLINQNYPNMNRRFYSNMAHAIHFSSNRKLQPITGSSRNIVKKNNFQWIGKIIQLMNFYEKGKLLSFGMDMELFLKTGGQTRLLNVLRDIKTEYNGKSFTDGELRSIFMDFGHEDLGEFFDKYIYGTEQVTYQKYLDELGLVYYPKKTKIPSYAKKLRIFYNFDHQMFSINKVGRNNMGLKKGDLIHSINGDTITMDSYQASMYLLTNPESDNTIEVVVKRNGQLLTLTGEAVQNRKIKSAFIAEQTDVTDKQIENWRKFFNQ